MNYATATRGLIRLAGLALIACSDPRVDLGSDARNPSAGAATTGTSLLPPADDRNLHPGLLPMPPAAAGVFQPPGPVSPPPPVSPGVPPVRLSPLIIADPPPPPISGGTLTVADDGSVAVAADPDRDAVYLVRVADGSVDTVALAPGSEPGRSVLDASGYAHVVLRGGGALARIDLSAGQLERTTKVCAWPRGVAYDAASDALWVACASGELVSLDAATHAERSRVFVAIDLRDVVIDAAGGRFVSRYRSAELLRIAADGSVASRQPPASTQPDTLSSAPQADFATSPTLAWRTIRGPSGDTWMLHQRSRDDAVAGGGGWGMERRNMVTRPQLTHYDSAGAAVTSLPVDERVTLAVDLASSRDGRWLAVADPAAYLQAGPTVFVMPVDSLARGTALTDTPPDARAVSISPNCTGGAAQASSVAFDQAGLLYVFAREPAALDVYALDPTGAPGGVCALHSLQSFPLASRSVRDTGNDMFHVDVGSGIACASCHGEAQDDGHVWALADSARRTQNLRGGLLGTLPLHWQGEFASFRTLVEQVMTLKMNGYLAQAEYSDALGNWLDKQPALRLEVRDPDAVARGQRLFESSEVGCSGCHSGAAFTNNQTVDVGTGGAFQVPSLRGVAMHPPFMHNACAHSLEERFDPSCGGSLHGNTLQLTAVQRADLIAYLSSI
jgi:hypothetical protein